MDSGSLLRSVRGAVGLFALVLLAACGASEQDEAKLAPRNDLICDLTYNMLIGPDILESQAKLEIDLDISPLGETWTVKKLEVTKAWEGRGELDPWRLFTLNRARPIEAIEGDVITLFTPGGSERGFTINRVNGDTGWASAMTMGEVEYFGECRS
jgi:hypothetical protein